MAVALAAVALTTWTPARAVVIVDFNNPAYSNGSLVAQDGWAGDTANLNVVNNPTDGWLQFTKPAVAPDKVATKVLATAETPDANNKILIKFDVIAGSGPAGFVGLILFKDSAGVELSRSELQPFLIRGRGAGGAGIVTTGMTVGGVDPTIRTWWISLDSVAKTATYYHDSIAPANLMGGTNPLAWGAGALSEVKQIQVTTRGTVTAEVGLIDNIGVGVPEPTAIALLGLGGLLMRRRRMS